MPIYARKGINMLQNRLTGQGKAQKVASDTLFRPEGPEKGSHDTFTKVQEETAGFLDRLVTDLPI